MGVTEWEGLQNSALETGGYLQQALGELTTQFPIIGDVRDRALYLGVELVRDPVTLPLATTEADMVINELRERGVLLSTDGPHGNVLKTNITAGI